jgi:hypothetical protein
MLAGHVTAFFLFDVANAIDLSAVRARIGDTAPARLRTRPSAPPYLQYQEAPLTLDGAAVGVADVDGFRVRFKVFEYGVVTVAFTRPLPGDWDALVRHGIALQSDRRLSAEADRLCRQLLDRMGPAVIRPHDAFLTEDYLVFALVAGPESGSGEALLAERGPAIAQLLRGEHEPLSDQERDAVLSHRISYYASDVAVITWSSALVYDTEEGAQGIMEILEFANSQLLEFRYYDRLLDQELARIYTRLQAGGWSGWATRRHTRAARQVQAFVIELTELTDKTENALKIVGDVYAARLFNVAATRLGLDQWKANVRNKLKTVDDIYRFAVERASIARGEFLELTVVVLILLEIVLLMLMGE